MKPQDPGNRRSVDQDRQTRNQFGVMDVPNPNDQEVLEFAAGAKLAGTSDDENAVAWATPSDRNQYDTIEGNWSSRWNGGADPTIPCSTGIMERAEGSLTHSAKAQQGWLESISI